MKRARENEWPDHSREVVTWSDAVKAAHTWLCICTFRSGPWNVLPTEMVYAIAKQILDIVQYFPGDIVRGEYVYQTLQANGKWWKSQLTPQGRALQWVHRHVVLFLDDDGVRRARLQIRQHRTETAPDMIACLKCRAPIVDAYAQCIVCGYRERQRDLEFPFKSNAEMK